MIWRGKLMGWTGRFKRPRRISAKEREMYLRLAKILEM
jgi:hypothetical protein